MDKEVIFAVAGSGKTSEIIRRIDDKRRFLILTYTDENLLNLRTKIITRYGQIPANVSVMTYFSFLHSFCFRPLAGFDWCVRGINFDDSPPLYFKDTDQRYYMDGVDRLYKGRIAKAVIKYFAQDALQRVEQFFDVFYVDEVQDFAGHDLNLLLHLTKAKIEFLMVGDFWQHTYDTSRDGSTNKRLHDSFKPYVERFLREGIKIDDTSLSRSHRCSAAVCAFITDNLGVPIETHSTRPARIDFVDSLEQADELRARGDVVKLFYSQHYLYGCHSQNWGASKGEDHHDEVCVVLNQTTLTKYREEKLADLAPQTLNKLYVALSRSRGNVYLAPHTFFKPVRVS